MEEKMNLAAKIAKISSEIGALAKTGRNAQQGYAYIEYAAVAPKISSLQEKYGVAIVPCVEDYKADQIATAKGGVGYHYILNMTFRVINTENPEENYEAKWLGESTDYGDKGINKAETSATKYFLMRLYHISDKNEEEADKTTPEQKPKPQPKNEANKPKIDHVFLSKVRGKLPTLKTAEEIEAYWKELHLNKTYYQLLMGDFKKRKQEITNAAKKR